ncbi:MAG: hypothetical protein H7829_15350 [Magnetococcus sp. THC-1_WYH]
MRACVDTEIKKRAGVILENTRLNSAGRLPFEVKQPNQATADAMDELESGQGKQFDTTDALFHDLGIEQCES